MYDIVFSIHNELVCAFITLVIVTLGIFMAISKTSDFGRFIFGSLLGIIGFVGAVGVWRSLGW